MVASLYAGPALLAVCVGRRDDCRRVCVRACARACFHSVKSFCELGCAPTDCPDGAEGAARAGGRWRVARFSAIAGW